MLHWLFPYNNGPNSVTNLPPTEQSGLTISTFEKSAERRGAQFGEAFAGLTTPSAPSLRSAQPPLLCEEGNTARSQRLDQSIAVGLMVETLRTRCIPLLAEEGW